MSQTQKSYCFFYLFTYKNYYALTYFFSQNINFRITLFSIC